MLTQENINLIFELYYKKTLTQEDNDFSKILEATKLKDFFVKPEDNQAFAKALETAIEVGKEFGTHLFKNKNAKYTQKQAISYTTGYLIILAIKSYANLDYLHEQAEKARSITTEDKDFLKERLFKLTEEELKSWFEIAQNFNLNYRFFSDGHLFDMQQEFNSACYAKDPSVQKINDENFTDFFCTTSDLFNDYFGREFDFLSADIIAGIIFKYVDGDFYILGKLAEIIHNDGYDAAVNYLTTTNRLFL